MPHRSLEGMLHLLLGWGTLQGGPQPTWYDHRSSVH